MAHYVNRPPARPAPSAMTMVRPLIAKRGRAPVQPARRPAIRIRVTPLPMSRSAFGRARPVEKYPPICMPAESAAKVGGAAPKDRYEREPVLTRSSVRCQAKTADLLPPRTRTTGGSAGARFVLRSATTSHLRSFILARCRCRRGPVQAGKGVRLRRCGARPCLVKEVACRGISVRRRCQDQVLGHHCSASGLSGFSAFPA